MKKDKVNTTQEIAIDFAQRTVSAINKQLAVEITRNGFSMDAVRSGKQKLERTVKASESDPRFIMESFTISGRKIPERIIMVVKWSPKGLEIERNSDAVANAIKANPNFGVKKGSPTLFVGEVTQREIDIEARANEYMKADEAKAKKELFKC